MHKSQLLLIGVLLGANVMNAQWVSQGPYGNVTTTLLHSGSSLFAGTGLGVFRSNDMGTTWVHKSNGFLNMQVGVLAESSNYLLAGTYGGGVYRSADAGDSWSPANTGLTNQLVYDLAVSGTRIFVATNGGSLHLTMTAIRGSR